MFNNPKDWSLNLGREGIVTMRIHMVVLLCLVSLVGFATNHENSLSHIIGTVFATTLIASFLVFTSTMAHFVVIYRSGGTVRSVCFLPWGSIFQYGKTTTVAARRQAYVVSMITSLTLIFAGVFLLSMGQPNPWSTAIHPLASLGLDWTNVDRSFVELFTKLAIAKFCLNLIPLAPFGSGYFLETWLVPRPDSHKNQITANFLVATGHAMAIALFMYGVSVRNEPSPVFNPSTFLGPGWVAPMLGGIFLSYLVHNRYQFLAAEFAESETTVVPNRKRRRKHVSHSSMVWDDSSSSQTDNRSKSSKAAYENEYDSSADLTEADLAGDSSEKRNKWEIWMEENQLSREDAKKLVEKTEDYLLDQILEKVNATGLKSLSIDEKNLLERVSKRLRQK